MRKLNLVLLIALTLATGCSKSGDGGTTSETFLFEGMTQLPGTYEITVTKDGSKYQFHISDETYSDLHLPTEWKYTVNKASWLTSPAPASMVAFGVGRKGTQDYFISIVTKSGATSANVPPGFKDEYGLALGREGDEFIMGGDHEEFELGRIRRIGD